MIEERKENRVLMGQQVVLGGTANGFKPVEERK